MAEELSESDWEAKPTSKDTRKRLSPSDSDDSPDQSPSKRRRVEPTLPQTPPPEVDEVAHVSETHLFDDDPHQLLQRSVALVLNHVGFTGATPEALEALCSEVDSCQYLPPWIR